MHKVCVWQYISRKCFDYLDDVVFIIILIFAASLTLYLLVGINCLEIWLPGEMAGIVAVEQAYSTHCDYGNYLYNEIQK